MNLPKYPVEADDENFIYQFFSEGSNKFITLIQYNCMSTNANKKPQSNITVVHGMQDFSKDPLVIEKLERARAFFAKNGLPKTNKPKKAK